MRLRNRGAGAYNKGAMSTTTTPSPTPPDHPHDITPGEALWHAWLWWLVLLLLPFFVFIAVLFMWLFFEPTPNETVANVFFVISMLWLLVSVPTAFALRSHCFKAWWEGQTVEPRSYLRGMVTIWMASEIGGLIALIGCLASGSLMPTLVPAAVAFMLFVPFWPSGRALVDAVGTADDDTYFREPR